jgi:hypothetical protein
VRRLFLFAAPRQVPALLCLHGRCLNLRQQVQKVRGHYSVAFCSGVKIVGKQERLVCIEDVQAVDVNEAAPFCYIKSSALRAHILSTMIIKDPAELVVGETYKVRYYLLPPGDANPADVPTVEQEFQAKFEGSTDIAFSELGGEGWADASGAPFLEFEGGPTISASFKTQPARPSKCILRSLEELISGMHTTISKHQLSSTHARSTPRSTPVRQAPQ